MITAAFRFIVVFIFTFNYAFAQPSAFKHIAKGKYEKLEKLISKGLEKDSTDCELLYVQGVLFNVKDYSKFNPEQAREKFNLTLKNFFMLEEKEKNKLIKSGITTDSIFFHRNISFDHGLEIAQSNPSVESFQYFIDVYIESVSQKQIAIKSRDIFAFRLAKAINSEDGFSKFLASYPQSLQVDSAIVMRDERGFEAAVKSGTSKAMISFMEKYPNTEIMEKAEFQKNRFLFNEQTDGTVAGYMRFCDKNERSVFFDRSMDSIEVISFRERNLEGLKYLVKNSMDVKNYSSVQDKLFDLFLFDGHPNTFSYFKREYVPYLDNIHKRKFTDLSASVNEEGSLFLKIGVTDNNYGNYESFVNDLAPFDLAWVGLQRMIEQELKDKQWIEVKSILRNFENSFETPTRNRVKELLEIMQEPDRTVVPERVKIINTTSDEYAPVPGLDGKKIYFSGKNRKDNIGGEDIFVSTIKAGQYTPPVPVASLSTDWGNEAPLSISADGNTMLLWSGDNGGDILISEMQSDGSWSEPEILPAPINSSYYEGDAMISADGKTLIFVSTRPGGMNLYTENNIGYFGDDNYPTDIYISKRSSKGKWMDPLNLGSQINTPYSERSPYLHPDGKTLYFSSEGHTGFGRLDVFKTELTDPTDWKSWSKPQNLGKEINSSSNDWGFKFSTDGKNVFLAAKDKSPEKSSLLLLLDVSGSMEDNDKIEAMKEAAREVCLNALANNTEVAVLAFDGECYEPVKFYREFTNDALELTDFISSLSPGGRTPMYEALELASDFLRNYASFDSKNKTMMLMSDGNATSCSELKSVMAKIKKQGSKNKVFTIALEVDEYSQAYEDLNYIAQSTGGEFFHAESATDLGSAFAQASNKIFDFALKNANSDIYRFVLPEDLRPEVVSTISGMIKNSDNKPLEATILWEDLTTGENVGTAKSSPVDGSYFIVLPVGKNYGYFVEHPDYFPSSNNVDLRNSTSMEEIQVNIGTVSYNEMINQQKAVLINNIFFETAKFDLKTESYMELKRVVSILNKYPGMKIEVGGHTDNIGGEAYNKDLSEKRARAVANQLNALGVNNDLIVAKGFGYSFPVTDNSSEEKRAKNRRVEIRFIKQ